VPRARARFLRHVRTQVSPTGWVQLLITAVIAIFVVALPAAPIDWDARSIWLFHASWLHGSADVYLQAQLSPELVFSHPNYPLFGSASMAVVWAIAGGAANFSLGLQVVGLITVLTTALAGSFTIKRLVPTVHPVVGSVAFALFLMSVLTIAWNLLGRGSMDPLQAALVVCVAAVLLPSLSTRMPWSDAALASVVGFAAINVKQEGFWFTLAVMGVFVVVSFRQQYWAKYVPLAALVLGFGGWKGFLALVHSNDTTDASGIAGRLPELLDFASPAWLILKRLAGEQARPTLVPIGLVVIVLLIALNLLKPGWATVRTSLFVFASWSGIIAIVAITYALGETRNRIDWWLLTSYDRVIGTAELFAWFIVFVGVLLVSPWGSPERKAVVE